MAEGLQRPSDLAKLIIHVLIRDCFIQDFLRHLTDAVTQGKQRARNRACQYHGCYAYEKNQKEEEYDSLYRFLAVSFLRGLIEVGRNLT
ncbi:hypothetical protein MBAV_003851 [Candidatus Magnetobacterium bavaricum]|uniref:Uncharacterized protein n=1 Tax=Candidatus Magnetobacterium bavaricum TaxID=29290 RepID=A0A0F3GQ65_9BACT|nr:hypothetical protein MBAV_003851 [Candidatus Magnetobacterium bavaricum]